MRITLELPETTTVVGLFINYNDLEKQCVAAASHIFAPKDGVTLKMVVGGKFNVQHPEKKKTYKQDFLEKFPNAAVTETGGISICRQKIYGGKAPCEDCYNLKCKDCWNEEMPDE